MPLAHSAPILVCEPVPYWINRLVRETQACDWQFRWCQWEEFADAGEASINVLVPPEPQAWTADTLLCLETIGARRPVLLLGDLDGPLEFAVRDLGVTSVLPADASVSAVLQTLALWKTTFCG